MHIKPAQPTFSRRLLRPGWTDVVPLVLAGQEQWPEARVVGHWSLVLDSQGIPHRLQRRSASEGGGTALLVQSWFVQRAVEEIQLFIRENPLEVHGIPRMHGQAVGNESTTMLFMALLVIFHAATTMAFPAFRIYPHIWGEIGSADAASILGGQWWRVITALTLHAGAAHVLGNALIGGAFIMLVCRRLGSGLGWFLVILAGALGNLVNTWVLGPPHNAIGFSTAVFGAAGLLAGVRPFIGRLETSEALSLRERFGRFMGTAFVPVAAGLGILAMLGSGGENTDLGAHLFGFVVGLLLGFAAGWGGNRYGRPGRDADRALLIIAVSSVLLAWAMAFSQQ